MPRSHEKPVAEPALPGTRLPGGADASFSPNSELLLWGCLPRGWEQRAGCCRAPPGRPSLPPGTAARRAQGRAASRAGGEHFRKEACGPVSDISRRVSRTPRPHVCFPRE